MVFPTHDKSVFLSQGFIIIPGKMGQITNYGPIPVEWNIIGLSEFGLRGFTIYE